MNKYMPMIFTILAFNVLAEKSPIFVDKILGLAIKEKESFCKRGVLFRTTIRSGEGFRCEDKKGASVAMLVCDKFSGFEQSHCAAKAKKVGISDASMGKIYLTEQVQPWQICSVITEILPKTSAACQKIVDEAKGLAQQNYLSVQEKIAQRKREEASQNALKEKEEAKKRAQLVQEQKKIIIQVIKTTDLSLEGTSDSDWDFKNDVFNSVHSRLFPGQPLDKNRLERIFIAADLPTEVLDLVIYKKRMKN